MYTDFEKALTDEIDIKLNVQNLRKIVKFFRGPRPKHILDKYIKKKAYQLTKVHT